MGQAGGNKTVFLHGDEYLHWATDQYGRPVEIGADGSVRSIAITRSALSYNKYLAREARRKDAPRSAIPSSMTMGNNHFLVLLVEFSDVSFKVNDPKQAFSDLLNQPGYSVTGGTGSVHDYYYDQSSGKFDPIFDVVGPLKVSGAMADYGGNSDGWDKNPAGALLDACAIAEQQGLDFSIYDNDGDGYVDNLYFFYAGYSEAEGGGDDTIWPHASFLYGKNSASYDGVKLGRYACGSELSGRTGVSMAGIGTFCHEFGHVIGLPDFYDTNYEENGSSEGLLGFSLMSGGPYNNGGNTPPNLNAIERNLLGWMELPTEWTEDGTISIPPITNNVAYITPTTTDGEYFLYEVRDGSGWDAYIRMRGSDPTARGLVVYHVDQSLRLVDGISAAQRWEDWNGINDYSSHPCFKIVHASGSPEGYQDLTFPGGKGVTALNESTGHTKTWDGGYSGFDISDISFDGSSVSATLVKNRERKIFGIITTSSGEALSGVSISAIDKNSEIQPSRYFAPGKARTDRQVRLAAAVATATSDANGEFSIEIPATASSSVELEFFKSRYQPKNVSIEISAGSMVKNVILLNAAEGGSSDLQKYRAVSNYALGINENPCSVTTGVRFSASELSTYAGMKISGIKFQFRGSSAEEVSVFVDFGDERVYTRKVDSPNYKNGLSSQDISSAGLLIPNDTPVVFGYALKNVNEAYPVTIASDDPGAPDGGLVRFDYEATGGGWEPLATDEGSYNAIISVTLQQVVSPFASFGVKIISNPGSYTAGSEYSFAFENATAGETPTGTDWYFDGAKQSAASITLTAGRHEVKAVNTYPDGHTEEIIQIIQVN